MSTTVNHAFLFSTDVLVKDMRVVDKALSVVLNNGHLKSGV